MKAPAMTLVRHNSLKSHGYHPYHPKLVAHGTRIYNASRHKKCQSPEHPGSLAHPAFGTPAAYTDTSSLTSLNDYASLHRLLIDFHLTQLSYVLFPAWHLLTPLTAAAGTHTADRLNPASQQRRSPCARYPPPPPPSSPSSSRPPCPTPAPQSS